MSTRSIIGRQNADGTVTGIYCHFDGYPSGVGAVLNEHYTDSVKVDALMQLGDLSSLGAEIGEKHDFDGPRNKDWCLAYGRDRGESGVDAATFAGRDAFVDARGSYGADYMYLFVDGAWQVRGRHDDFTPLTAELADVENVED